MGNLTENIFGIKHVALNMCKPETRFEYPCPVFNCEYFRVTVSYLIVHVDTISLAKHYENLSMESCLNCNNLTKRLKRRGKLSTN